MRLMMLLVLVVLVLPAPGKCQEVEFTSTEAEKQIRVVDLSATEMQLLEDCGRELTQEEKIELAETEPQDREEWLRIRCRPNTELFVMCSPSLTVRLQKAYAKLSDDAQYLWLQLYCRKTLRGEVVSPLVVSNSHPARLSISDHMASEYRCCRPQLSAQERADFLELAPNQRIFWLSNHCNDVAIIDIPIKPKIVPDVSYSTFKQKKTSKRSWPTSRIVAHVTFWPGIVALGTGLSLIGYASSTTDSTTEIDGVYETRSIWAPFVVGGGVFTLVGLMGAITYRTSKLYTKRGYALLVPSEQGLVLGYGRAF